jgi:hypothetical protein
LGEGVGEVMDTGDIRRSEYSLVQDDREEMVRVLVGAWERV